MFAWAMRVYFQPDECSYQDFSEANSNTKYSLISFICTMMHRLCGKLRIQHISRVSMGCVRKDIYKLYWKDIYKKSMGTTSTTSIFPYKKDIYNLFYIVGKTSTIVDVLL